MERRGDADSPLGLSPLTAAPSLLERFPDELREVWETDILTNLLSPVDREMLARTSAKVRKAVVATALPRAGVGAELPLNLRDFVGSTHRLAWAKDNGCPWDVTTSVTVVRCNDGGCVDILRWAHEHGCPW